MSVLRTAQEWLRGEGRSQVQQLLRRVPADLDIWEVPADGFDRDLGPDSPAWELWEIIAIRQDGAGFAGKYVTASKLLHGKRPRLIPIYDRGGIGEAPRCEPQGHLGGDVVCTARPLGPPVVAGPSDQREGGSGTVPATCTRHRALDVRQGKGLTTEHDQVTACHARSCPIRAQMTLRLKARRGHSVIVGGKTVPPRR